ncbi:MAG: adenylate/guanylate cyclase domain-containing protein [Gammaproteobacteria bacterium]|nr:adenylate/guanylate cyclase domain-containing protein [Gammaproteobacteria bacterium]
MKGNWVRVSLGALVLVVFLLHASTAVRLGFVDQMENLAYDAHLEWTVPNTRDDSVVIVDIDEVSLRAEGRWPWPRAKLAQLVRRLFDDYQVRLVGFDIVFAEPDESSGLKVLESLADAQLRDDTAYQAALDEVRPSLDYDEIFAEAIGEYPVILGYYFNIDAGDGSDTPRVGALPEPVFGKSVFQGKNIQFITASGYGSNLALFNDRAAGAGHFTQEPDRDGVVRRVPMLIKYDDAYYASLSLEIVRRVLGVDDIVPRFEKPLFDTRGYPGLEWLMVGAAAIPVDHRAKTLVPFRGGQGSFEYVPAVQVLHKTADKASLADKIVLIGTSAPGLLDLRATPVGEAYPGVEVHANLIAGILNGTTLQAPAYTLGAEVVLLFIIGIGMIVAGSVLSPLYTTLFTVTGIIAYIVFNHIVWSNGVVLPVASGILMVLTMFLLHMSYGYFVETRGKRQITGLFGQYVPPELVDEMAKAPTAYSLEAESRELTVLFSDVRGFTTLSEGLSPRDLSELMNQFLTPMTAVIHRNRGTIDKYMGDAIMAFWGAPLSDADHARHAVEAGMAMLAGLEEINHAFAERGWPAVRIGVGINTGLMSVGNMGSEFRMAYTVLGDAVNLGSRLEGLTKNYGVSIICSETTVAAVPEYAYRELDRVRVKGKAQPVAIYEPLCRREELDAAWKKELKLYHDTMRMYRMQEWDMAELNLLNLKQTSRSPQLYEVYIERIQHFRKEPPPGEWDGVFDHKTK